MKKRIILIWPHIGKGKTPLSPLWALSLSSYLKKYISDIEIRILDEQIVSSKLILKEINQFKPNIVGISLSYNHYSRALFFARKAKLLNAKVVVGGAFASALAKEILLNRGFNSKDYCIDVVIKGDGEKAFYEYVVEKPLEKINNLIYLRKNKVKENSTEFLNLDNIPLINRNLLNMEDYFKRQGPIKEWKKRTLNVYAQKGCSWREKTGGCIFCCFIDKYLRLKDPKVFAKELVELIFRYNVDIIKIDGEDFLGNIKWFKSFAKIYNYLFYLKYKNKYSFGMFYPSIIISARADKINKEIIGILKEINVVNIFVGFESGNEKCLKALRKGISLKTMEKAAGLLNLYKIYISASFILGLPGETPKALKETLSFIKKIISLNYTYRLRLQSFTPLPGSLSWEIFIKKTGNKYKGKDLINWNEARKEWIGLFTYLEQKDIEKAEKDFKRLAGKHNKVCRFIDPVG
jgi:anaerobic magnesium-protoporphyrin IX monomethyl ester cyclase